MQAERSQAAGRGQRGIAEQHHAAPGRVIEPGKGRVAAGAAFVIGSQSQGQMVGEFPGLATLDTNENLRVTSDFRAMYCSLLEEWLGFDSAAIIPGAEGFEKPKLVRV